MLDNFNKDIFQNPTKVNQLKARKHKGVTLSTIHVYVLYIYARKKTDSCLVDIKFFSYSNVFRKYPNRMTIINKTKNCR